MNRRYPMNLFLELRRHGKLAEKRHPMYEKSRFARFWMYLMAVFWLGYLLFLGTMFAFAFDNEAVEPYHVLNAGLVFILAFDFVARFPFQQTPTQEVKPYLLLPVRRNKLIDFMLVRSGMSGINFIWLFLFVPFALITVTKFYGLWGVVTYNLGIWLLVLANNYWYLLCRTLLGERIWWVLLPIAVYGGIAAAMLIPDDSPIFDWSVSLGDAYITGNPLAFLATVAVMALMWLADSRVIRRLIYNELNKVEDSTVKVKTLSEYKFLDRYGLMGEYVRLELKLLLRNKMCRKSLISISCLVMMLSLAVSFTDIYGRTGGNFFVLYNYVIFGLTFLSTLMSYEGNYIDGLMSRRESIYSLLRAKYALYAAGLLLPFALMIPGVVKGNIGLLQSVSWMLFTAGPVYCTLFLVCPFNNRTVGLDTKLTNRQNMGTGLQQIVSFAALGLPFGIYYLCCAFWDETVTQWILAATGLCFILTSRLWLRQTYRLFMKRRYKNMEGFRDSRQK